MITSRENPKLKLVRKLAARRQRDKLGLYVCEGEDLVAAALEGGWELETALVDAARPPDLRLPRPEQVASHLLAEVSSLGHAPRVIAEAALTADLVLNRKRSAARGVPRHISARLP